MPTGCEYCLNKTPEGTNKEVVSACSRTRRKIGNDTHRICEMVRTDPTSAFSPWPDIYN